MDASEKTYTRVDCPLFSVMACCKTEEVARLLEGELILLSDTIDSISKDIEASSDSLSVLSGIV